MVQHALLSLAQRAPSSMHEGCRLAGGCRVHEKQAHMDVAIDFVYGRAEAIGVCPVVGQGPARPGQDRDQHDVRAGHAVPHVLHQVVVPAQGQQAFSTTGTQPAVNMLGRSERLL